MPNLLKFHRTCRAALNFPDISSKHLRFTLLWLCFNVFERTHIYELDSTCLKAWRLSDAENSWVYSILLESTWNSYCSCVVNRRNRPVTLAFGEDFENAKVSEVHLDSTCPRVGALIYDSKAGWSHKTLCCLSRSWTKATCRSGNDYKHIKHHQKHRYVHFTSFYILPSSTFGGRANQSMRCPILNSHQLAQALACDSLCSPLQLVQLARWESQMELQMPSRRSVCGHRGVISCWWSAHPSLNFWFGNTPCGAVR